MAPTNEVDTHLGQITINGRTVKDEHLQASMTLRNVIRLSSNVGIAQFSQRLSAREEFEALRNAGFGSPTGLPVPGEAAGSLPDPVHWSKQTPVSLAIGYEVAVTPLPMALAYSAIANGGELLEPGLVREIRDPDGTVMYRRQRRVVRRLMSEDIARQLREMLVATVAKGTASEAEIPSYIVAGKTGTARRTEYGAGYGRNEYNASFVGLFPGRDPEYVILVKIDDPTSSYFGGKTAAPLFKVILELRPRRPGRVARPDRRWRPTVMKPRSMSAPAPRYRSPGGRRPVARRARRRGPAGMRSGRQRSALDDHERCSRHHRTDRPATPGSDFAARDDRGRARSPGMEPAGGRARAASGGPGGPIDRWSPRHDGSGGGHRRPYRHRRSPRGGRVTPAAEPSELLAERPVASRAVSEALRSAGVLVSERGPMPECIRERDRRQPGGAARHVVHRGAGHRARRP